MAAVVLVNQIIVDIVCLGIQLLFLATPSHQKSTLFQGEVINPMSSESGQYSARLLRSENGMFILQFDYSLRNTRFDSVEKDTVRNIYLGIWYNANPYSSQPLWIANQNSPNLGYGGDYGGLLTIDDKDGCFKISNGTQSIVIFAPTEDAYRHASYNSSLTLEDSGNLVLRQLNLDGSIKQILWQSFDHPTDTLLPEMKLGIDHRSGHIWSLTSLRSELSYAVGAFTFGIDPNDKTQLMIWKRRELFWKSDVGNTSLLFPAFELFNFSYISNENETYISYTIGTQDIRFSSLRMEPNGRLVGYGDAFEGETDEGHGCGEPPLYSLFEEGCMHWKLPECRISSNGQDHPFDEFTSHLGIMASQGFKYSETENMTLEECRRSCIEKCSCVAYSSINTDETGCEIWNSTFSFIKSLPAYYDPSERMIYFIDKENTWWKWVTVAVGFAIIIPPFICFCYMIWVNFKDKGVTKINLKSLFGLIEENILPNTSNGASEKHGDDENELQMFNFETIAAATNYFSETNKVGEGGFGPVYKGNLMNGQEIAIKRLSRSSGQGFLEFRNEVILIAKLQHTSLVRLLGLCIFGVEMILVYEYMPNKSLDFILFDVERKCMLDWKKRFHIIEGIAQGLLYLHKYSRLRVIHCDLKASNVLLDDEMNPKISDFGMAKIFSFKQSETNTKRVVGTYGYMSPEYALHGVVSVKIDVFSFGVLLLEIASGRKNNSFCQLDEQPITLIGYAWQLWNEGHGLQLVDQTLGDINATNVMRCIHIGLLCVQDQAIDRPTMCEVVTMLSNETLELAYPKQPAFFVGGVADNFGEVHVNDENCSKNTITISVMEAR